MKQITLFLVLFVSFLSSLRSEDSQKINLKEGFRDLSFQTKLSEITGMVFDRKVDDYTFYKRPTDILKLGNVSLDTIYYRFWNEKFEAVTLERKTTFTVFHLVGDIKEFLISVYGKPTSTKEDTSASFNYETNIWEDDKTIVVYKITFAKNGIALRGTDTIEMFIRISSKEIEAERLKAKGDVNSKSPTGL